jgi:hypothetical protein
MRARCPVCGAGAPVRVYFDRECRRVVGGGHFQRICPNRHEWPEQCSEARARVDSRRLLRLRTAGSYAWREPTRRFDPWLRPPIVRIVFRTADAGLTLFAMSFLKVGA